MRRVRMFYDVAQTFLQQTKDCRHGAGRNLHRNVSFEKINLEAVLPLEFSDEITYWPGKGDLSQVAGEQVVREGPEIVQESFQFLAHPGKPRDEIGQLFLANLRQ